MGESSLADDLRAARARIASPANWARGGNINPEEGRFCAAVACNDFKHPGKMFGALYDELPERFRLTTMMRVGSVFMFNDHPDTTHADIVALFDRAIAVATGAA